MTASAGSSGLFMSERDAFGREATTDSGSPSHARQMMAARCGTECFRVYRWWTMQVPCGCIRMCRVGFGPRPRGNTDGMSRIVRGVAAAAASTMAAVVARDLFQRNHALLRNFPLLAHSAEI